MSSRGLSLVQKGIDAMARMCPLHGSYVLYSDCLECDFRFKCRKGEVPWKGDVVEEAEASRDRHRPVVQADRDKHSR